MDRPINPLPEVTKCQKGEEEDEEGDGVAADLYHATDLGNHELEL